MCMYSSLIKFLRKILRSIFNPCPTTLVLKATTSDFTVQGSKMNFTLRLDQGLSLAVAGVDAAGNTVELMAATSWSVSNGNVGTLSVDETGMHARFTPSALGTTQVSALATTDNGTQYETFCDVTVVPGLLAGIVITGVIDEPAPVVEPQP